MKTYFKITSHKDGGHKVTSLHPQLQHMMRQVQMDAPFPCVVEIFHSDKQDKLFVTFWYVNKGQVAVDVATSIAGVMRGQAEAFNVDDPDTTGKIAEFLSSTLVDREWPFDQDVDDKVKPCPFCGREPDRVLGEDGTTVCRNGRLCSLSLSDFKLTVGQTKRMKTFIDRLKACDMFAMSNLGERRTGVQAILWVSPKVDRHVPRIKVAKVGQAHGETFSVTISDTPEVIAGKKNVSRIVDQKTLKKIFKWVQRNELALLLFWEKKLEDIDSLLDLLEKV